jgi:Ni/Fe-hydrogenase 1 B-type cytochrome subunit
MKRVYVWEFPVRLTHWLSVACVITLALTGFYIGAPYLHAVDNSELIMAWMRFAHFTAAFALITSVLIRIYWFFRGNEHARFSQFLPTSRKRAKEAYRTGVCYIYCKEQVVHPAGHNALAGVAYTALFVMYFIEIVTGGAMLYVAYGGGTLYWLLGGWSLGIMSVAYLRLIHHILMWMIAAFVIVHVYTGWYNDIVEKNGMISSIFSGYKYHEDGH